jgi:hypothetical protein
MTIKSDDWHTSKDARYWRDCGPSTIDYDCRPCETPQFVAAPHATTISVRGPSRFKPFSTPARESRASPKLDRPRSRG